MKRKMIACFVLTAMALGAVMFASPKVRNVLKKRLRLGPEPVLVTPRRAGGKTILFLHHSTGNRVWNEGVQQWLRKYNRGHGTDYRMFEQAFPKREPYGWKNYPYDYWNLWVHHQGAGHFQREPTLEMICSRYDVVVFKHCFPVCKIHEDIGEPDVTSEDRRVENYKLQYEALKAKIHQYPDTAFILWTGAALAREATNEAQARRAQVFFEWVREEWDEPGDNIHLWDFYRLETEGSLYLQDDYTSGVGNSHPNPEFCKRVAPLLVNRVVDVIEGRGDRASLTGEIPEQQVALR